MERPGATKPRASGPLPGLQAEPSRASTLRGRQPADGQRAARERGRRSLLPTCWHLLPTTQSGPRVDARTGAGARGRSYPSGRPRGAWRVGALPPAYILDPLRDGRAFQDPSEPGERGELRRSGGGGGRRRSPKQRVRRAPARGRRGARSMTPAGAAGHRPATWAERGAARPGQTHPRLYLLSRVIDPAARVFSARGWTALPPASPRRLDGSASAFLGVPDGGCWRWGGTVPGRPVPGRGRFPAGRPVLPPGLRRPC